MKRPGCPLSGRSGCVSGSSGRRSESTQAAERPFDTEPKCFSLRRRVRRPCAPAASRSATLLSPRLCEAGRFIVVNGRNGPIRVSVHDDTPMTRKALQAALRVRRRGRHFSSANLLRSSASPTRGGDSQNPYQPSAGAAANALSRSTWRLLLIFSPATLTESDHYRCRRWASVFALSGVCVIPERLASIRGGSAIRPHQ